MIARITISRAPFEVCKTTVASSELVNCSITRPRVVVISNGNNIVRAVSGSGSGTVDNVTLEMLSQEVIDYFALKGGNIFQDFATSNLHVGGQLRVNGTTESQSIVYGGDLMLRGSSQGMLGNGFWVSSNEDGTAHAQVDNLTVRGVMRVMELIIEKLRAVKGALVISQASGKIELIEESLTRYIITTDQEQNPFMAGDLVRSQSFTGSGVNGYWVEVEKVEGNTIIIAKSQFSDSSLPKVGDELVQMGNRYIGTRQSLIYMSAVDDGKPRIELYHGVNSKTIANKQVAVFGWLGDIEGASGFGLWSSNVFLEGKIVVGSGSSGLGNLEEWGSVSGDIEQAQKDAADNARLLSQTRDYIDGALQEELVLLQRQIDGQIESYFYDYTPSLSNYPASQWQSDSEKEAHLGDTFTSSISGISWRWSKTAETYSWVEIADTATSKALLIASQAKDTADGKRRVFVTTPSPPYEVGDLWSQGEGGDLMAAIKKRLSGNYTASDWVKATKYTDDTRAEELSQEMAKEMALFNASFLSSLEDGLTSQEKLTIAQTKDALDINFDSKINTCNQLLNNDLLYIKHKDELNSWLNLAIAAKNRFDAAISTIVNSNNITAAMTNEYRNSFTVMREKLSKLQQSIDSCTEAIERQRLDRSNLLASYPFKVGMSIGASIFPYYMSGRSTESQVVLALNPFDITAPVWEARSLDGDADGGLNATTLALDNSSDIRLSCWVKQTNADSTIYFGLGTSGASEQYSGSRWQTQANPYFWYGDLPSMDEWYLLVGHVYGSDTLATTAHSSSGIYNTSGEKVVNITTIFRQSANSSHNGIRVMQYYGKGNGEISYFYAPRVDIMVDGVPTISELVKGADLASRINNAEQLSTNATNRLSLWADDSYISPPEKRALKDQWQQALSRREEIIKDVEKYSLTTHSLYTKYRSSLILAENAWQKYSSNSSENITIGYDYGNIAIFFASEEALRKLTISHSTSLELVIGIENLIANSFLTYMWPNYTGAGSLEVRVGDSVAYNLLTPAQGIALSVYGAKYNNFELDKQYIRGTYVKHTHSSAVTLTLQDSRSYESRKDVVVEPNIWQWITTNPYRVTSDNFSYMTIRCSTANVAIMQNRAMLALGNKIDRWVASSEDSAPLNIITSSSNNNWSGYSSKVDNQFTITTNQGTINSPKLGLKPSTLYTISFDSSESTNAPRGELSITKPSLSAEQAEYSVTWRPNAVYTRHVFSFITSAVVSEDTILKLHHCGSIDSSTAKYTFRNIGIYEGAVAPKEWIPNMLSTEYLIDTFKDDTTEVSGGVTIGSMIAVRDGSQGDIRAGICGDGITAPWLFAEPATGYWDSQFMVTPEGQGRWGIMNINESSTTITSDNGMQVIIRNEPLGSIYQEIDTNTGSANCSLSAQSRSLGYGYQEYVMLSATEFTAAWDNVTINLIGVSANATTTGNSSNATASLWLFKYVNGKYTRQSQLYKAISTNGTAQTTFNTSSVLTKGARYKIGSIIILSTTSGTISGSTGSVITSNIKLTKGQRKFIIAPNGTALIASSNEYNYQRIRDDNTLEVIIKGDVTINNQNL